MTRFPAIPVFYPTSNASLHRIALVAAAIVALALLALKFVKRHRLRLPLPPGPKALPLIGNLLDFPIEHSWLTFEKWSKQYSSWRALFPASLVMMQADLTDSDIIHLSAAGRHLIVLSSTQAVVDLIEKRSSVYSDRPRAVMLNEMYVLIHVERAQTWWLTTNEAWVSHLLCLI